MNRKISFDSILDSIVDKNSISKVFARSLVNEMATIIQQGLLRDNVVNLNGLGIFRLHSVAERPGRNIQTGETITIPAHRKVLFKPEKHLRELINNKYTGLSPKILDEMLQPQESDKEKTEPAKVVTPAFFTEKFDTFKEEKELSESPKIEKADKKIEQSDGKDLEKKAPPEEDKSKKKTAAILYSILALLIIIFLFIQFTGDEGEIETAQQEKEMVEEKVENKMDQQLQNSETSSSDQQQIKFVKYTPQKGDNLWKLASRNYKDGYLWPLILQANASKITNPDLIEPGIVLNIPILQNAKRLSATESSNLARGHVMAYQAYKKKNNSEALNHLFVANKYDAQYVKSSLAKIDNADLLSIKNISAGRAR